MCLGSSFHIVIALTEANKNPIGEELLEAYELSWGNWAGDPEFAFICDRGRYFLVEFAKQMTERGNWIDYAAKASPWQIGKTGRHGGIWQGIWRRVVWARQITGRSDVLLATAEVNNAKNSLSRKAGFSPTQWVLGRDIRLPADMIDDGEVERLGAQAAAATPTTRFARRTLIKQSCREAQAQAQNDDAMRRAELRQTRPSGGAFHVGQWVFYYDQTEAGKRPESMLNWRGLARVIGHQGGDSIWVVHRGLAICCSKEHLSAATDEEVRAWLVTACEADLIDTAPLSGGSGYIDIRSSPTPPPWARPEAAAAQPPPGLDHPARVDQPAPTFELPEVVTEALQAEGTHLPADPQSQEGMHDGWHPDTHSYQQDPSSSSHSRPFSAFDRGDEQS